MMEKFLQQRDAEANWPWKNISHTEIFLKALHALETFMAQEENGAAFRIHIRSF